MNLEWRLPVWREKQGDFLIEGANDGTPDVSIRGGVTPPILERFAEQLTLTFAYIAQHGDFHRAALAYAKDYSKQNGVIEPIRVPSVDADGNPEPVLIVEQAILRAEIARLNELVGFYERSNTARLLGIADSQLAAVGGVLGYVREKWATTSKDDGIRGDLRRIAFGPWFDVLLRWDQEGFPLSGNPPEAP